MNVKFFIFSLLTFVGVTTFSQEFVNVADITEFNTAIENAKPGTTIILKNGVWKDVNLSVYGKGTAENPITIKARKPGEVIITGDSKLEISGEYIVVEGLWFKDGKPTSGAVVSFRKSSKEFANNCRFTNNAITNYNPNYQLFKTHWVSVWGKNNRIDHNNFTGKKNEGTTLVVWLKGEQHIENNHRIDNNYFGHRPFLDRTNAETIRIGTSKYSMSSSKTIVEENIFEKCDAELEVISNKSCDNIFRNNLFLESKGTLTLRHGNNALVENNVFLGNEVPKVGGIRVINKGHIIRNNLLVGVKGEGNRSPICIMNGIPNSALNKYHQVENVSIQNNTLINCGTMEFGSGKNSERILTAKNTLFANNLIAKGKSKVLHENDDISGISFKNNIVETTGEFDENLFSKANIQWDKIGDIAIPSGSNKNLVSSFKTEESPKLDINGAERSLFAVGAFNLDSERLPKALKLKSGTSWKVETTAPKYKGRRVWVEPGIGTLQEAIKKASGETVLKLRDGTYFVNKEQRVNGKVTIQGNKNTIIKSEQIIEKSFSSFFKINENSTLVLKNLTLDGKVNTVKYAIRSPSKDASTRYSLFIDNCIFKNFNHESGYIFRVYTNTTLDILSIKNSYFGDSYRGLNLYTKDNRPEIMNVKNVNIENSVFKNIEQFAIKYKKTPEHPTVVGRLKVSNCVFSNVNNREKGKVIETKGIKEVAINHSVFENSKAIVNPVSLSGKENAINNCLVYSCGEIKTSKEATQNNILYKKPKWKDSENFTPHKRSPLLKINNAINRIGLLY